MDTVNESVVVLDGGKYEVRHANGVGLRALRYGEPWRDLTGDGFVLALVHRIEALEAEKTANVGAILASRPSTPDKAGVSDAMENLRAVLSDPEGRCCINGSDGDLKVVDESLAALTHFATQSAEAVRDGERLDWLERNAVNITLDGRLHEVMQIGVARDSIDAAMQEQSHD